MKITTSGLPLCLMLALALATAAQAQQPAFRADQFTDFVGIKSCWTAARFRRWARTPS